MLVPKRVGGVGWEGLDGVREVEGDVGDPGAVVGCGPVRWGGSGDDLGATAGENPPHVTGGYGGIEVRVYVYNRMFRASGSRALVGVDRVRVLVDY